MSGGSAKDLAEVWIYDITRTKTWLYTPGIVQDEKRRKQEKFKGKTTI